MIAGIYTHMAAAGAALAIGAGGAWWAQGQRYGLQIEQLQHQQTSAALARRATRPMAERKGRLLTSTTASQGCTLHEQREDGGGRRLMTCAASRRPPTKPACWPSKR